MLKVCSRIKLCNPIIPSTGAKSCGNCFSNDSSSVSLQTSSNDNSVYSKCACKKDPSIFLSSRSRSL